MCQHIHTSSETPTHIRDIKRLASLQLSTGACVCSPVSASGRTDQVCTSVSTSGSSLTCLLSTFSPFSFLFIIFYLVFFHFLPLTLYLLFSFPVVVQLIPCLSPYLFILCLYTLTFLINFLALEIIVLYFHTSLFCSITLLLLSSNFIFGIRSLFPDPAFFSIPILSLCPKQ